MNLPTYIESPLPQILDAIKQAEAPEAIFLLAHRDVRAAHHNLFYTVPQHSIQPSAYFLLLVVATDSKSCTAIQSRLECLLQPLAETTIWCIPLAVFNEKLAEGDYFTGTLVSKGECLYSAINKGIGTTRLVEHLNYTSRWYERALEFAAGAELYIIRKQHAMAAFHFHQCAEQAFTSIIYNSSGYRPSTHNIGLLYRYATWFEPQLLPLFSTSAEKESLGKWVAAYTGSRYNNDYSVRGKELEDWREKTSIILGYAKTAVRQVSRQLAQTG